MDGMIGYLVARMQSKQFARLHCMSGRGASFV